MRAAYAYAIRKTLRLRNTWVILIITVPLVLGLAGILPFTVSVRSAAAVSDEARNQLGLIIAYSSGIGSIMAVVVAIFAGFKGAAMFRDEVEDGSFLVMLSKPISRTTLITGKWLAYITSLVVYVFLLSLAHNIGVVIGSGNGIDGETIVKAIFLEWAVGIIFAVIFAGIALLFSTFLSSTQTAVITLGFGVLSSFTAIIQPITVEPQQYDTLSNSRTVGELFRREYTNANNETNTETDDDTLTRIASQLVAPTTNQTVLQGRQEFLQALIAANVLPIGTTPEQAVTSENASKVRSYLLSQIVVDTGEPEKYLNLRYIDISGHINAMSSFVLDSIFTQKEMSTLLEISDGRVGNARYRRVANLDNNIYYSASLAMLKAINNMSAGYTGGSGGTRTYTETNDETEAKLLRFFATASYPNDPSKLAVENNGTGQSVLYTASYEPYMNKNVVVVVYLVIALALTPIALFIIRRKDFR